MTEGTMKSPRDNSDNDEETSEGVIGTSFEKSSYEGGGLLNISASLNVGELAWPKVALPQT